ncbi:hypothetical protein [Sulfuriflexus sp.]|uniref:hypothetical protein n=1 Tax=Sulfuriflexus sp. TaxID=2015443 RepID=UPI0028CC309E|nr:hypothetical protein [Sulfuriflexus sp.]MDT8405596.1 hypothetical protein [Sulfuriflexus sp.]
MSSLADNRLVLYPREAKTLLSESVLTEALDKIGFIGEPFMIEGNKRYFAGSRFIDHISFLGCSPHINLTPAAAGQQYDTEFCHVSFLLADAPLFLAGDNLAPPSCPSCRKRQQGGQLALSAWQTVNEDMDWQCEHCGQEHAYASLNWRRTAAIAQSSIHVWGVHESEAVPNASLLECLHGLKVGDWDYFYRITR